MATAIDGSSPARVSAVGDPTNGGSTTTAAFTAPANSLIVACVEYDTSNTWSAGTRVVSDSGGLTWTTQVERLGNETTAGGGSGIFTAIQVTSASRTVTFTTGTATPASGWGTGRISMKVYVVTGADVSGTPVDTVGASNEGGSTTNNLTTSSVTPGADGHLIAADCDWNALGVFDASSDLTQDTSHYASAISVDDGYKTTISGVGVTANLNANGASAAQHKWCQITVRAATAGGAVLRFLSLLGAGQ